MWMEWRKAKTYHFKSIERYQNTVSVNGQKWLDKMIGYHKRCLDELNAAKPHRLVDR